MSGAATKRRGAEALGLAADFLSEWQRVNSLLGFMEDALAGEVGKSGDAPPDVAENVMLNMYWLRAKLEDSAILTIKALEAEGYAVGPRA